MTDTLTPEKREEIRKWPEPKISNPDILQPTGVPYFDCLIHRLLDTQQDINSAANERMSQSLCDASMLMDEVEDVIRKCAALPALLSALDAAIERAEKAEAKDRLADQLIESYAASFKKLAATLGYERGGFGPQVLAERLVAERDALKARVEELEGALRWVRDWINQEVPIPTRNATTALGVVLDTLAGCKNAALKEKNDEQG